jgi:CSLREA domain-containing protein
MFVFRRQSLRLGLICVSLLVVFCLFLSTRPNSMARGAPRAAFVVNSNADTIADDGFCTLREAITNANGDSQLYATAGECAAGSGADTITFAGNYTITLAGSQLPIVTSYIIISGNGAANTIIQAAAAPQTATSRVFQVNSGGNLTLDGVTVRNGYDNSHDGGGIYNTGGKLTIMNSTVSDNWEIAPNINYNPRGGGVFSTGLLTITNSTFSGNKALDIFVGGYGQGGGIWSSNSAVIMNSTFDQNKAGSNDWEGIYSGGGGLYTEGKTTITNNTFLANTAGTRGGAILTGGNGTLTVTNSTIRNSVENHSSSTATLKNTIVTASCIGTITADAFNLATASTCGGATQVTFAQLNLGALTGSPTYLPLLPGSVAIDAGDNTVCPATDQRGQARNDLQCDVGAYELKYADSPTVYRPVATDTVTTFGPALMGIQRDAGFTDPGVITVTKSAWSTQGPESIGATWAITPTTTSGFSLTLQLCYTDAELGSLTESALRFWRYSGGAWTMNATVPTLSTVNGNRCAAVSGIQELSTWTLATSTPTAVTLERLAASANPIGGVGAIGLVLAAVVVIGSGRAVWLRRKRQP